MTQLQQSPLSNHGGFSEVQLPDQDDFGDVERWERIPILPDSYAVMLFGKRGSGKSAAMAYFGLEEYELGKNVWYWPPDYTFKYGEPIEAKTLYSLPDWLRNGAVLIDELQVLMNSLRTMSTANIMGGTMFQQLRKRGLNIYGTSNQPGRLDATVSLQTNMHAFCDRLVDDRCAAQGYHGPTCHDTILLNWVDTNKEFGIDARYYDGRKRFKSIIGKIRDVYPIYNTGAVADVTDVMAITKEAVLAEKEGRQVGLSEDELIDALRDNWIPWAVEQGHKRLTPAAFARSLNETHDLQITSRALGRALAALNLGAKKTNQGRIVVLPTKDQLAAWRSGLWQPD